MTCPARACLTQMLLPPFSTLPFHDAAVTIDKQSLLLLLLLLLPSLLSYYYSTTGALFTMITLAARQKQTQEGSNRERIQIRTTTIVSQRRSFTHCCCSFLFDSSLVSTHNRRCVKDCRRAAAVEQVGNCCRAAETFPQIRSLLTTLVRLQFSSKALIPF